MNAAVRVLTYVASPTTVRFKKESRETASRVAAEHAEHCKGLGVLEDGDVLTGLLKLLEGAIFKNIRTASSSSLKFRNDNSYSGLQICSLFILSTVPASQSEYLHRNHSTHFDQILCYCR